jgi:hypothetical protein
MPLPLLSLTERRRVCVRACARQGLYVCARASVSVYERVSVSVFVRSNFSVLMRVEGITA